MQDNKTMNGLQLTSLEDFELNNVEDKSESNTQPNAEDMDFSKFSDMVNGISAEKTPKGLFGMTLFTQNESEKTINIIDELNPENIIINLTQAIDPKNILPFIRVDLTVPADNTKVLFSMNNLVNKYIAKTHDHNTLEEEHPLLICSICPRRPLDYMLKFGLQEMQLVQPVFSALTASSFGKQSDTLSLLFINETVSLQYNDCSSDPEFVEDLKIEAGKTEAELRARLEEDEKRKEIQLNKEKEYLMQQEEFRKKNAEMTSVNDKYMVGRDHYDSEDPKNAETNTLLKSIYESQEDN